MEEIERVNENSEFREYISYEEEQRKIRNEFRKEGYELGIEEERNSIIKKMLISGMEITEIAKITEISEDKINEIKDNIKKITHNRNK